MKPKRRRNNKQTPFYAITEDGKVYAANRKARRIAYAQKAVVRNQTPPLIQTPDTAEDGVASEFAVTQGEEDGSINSSSV